MLEGCWQSLRAQFEPRPIADVLWRRALSTCLLARQLDAERQAKLRRLATVFLARKDFHALAGAVLDDYWRLLIAMQACLPALQQGARSLRGWHSILIYPGEFNVRRRHHDAASCAVTESDGAVEEASERGPLVLSLADVQLDLEQPWDGYNVVIHEIAHKLDRLDGTADGVPPLATIPRREWVTQFQQAHGRLVQTLTHGGDSEIHPCAGESVSEYFAVVSELHYSQPGALRKAEPVVADLLHAFYGPSPADGYDSATAR
ncbi:MAG: M90 family metallopeptidase [Rhodanobacter sp.]